MTDAAVRAGGPDVQLEDPITVFSELLERAARICAEPGAMVLSTVDRNGRPSGRYVLLKGVDQRGFVFYTNVERKARALAANPWAALTFYWAPLEKQVRVEGRVERVAEAEADAYFATRPRESQISAWASTQSARLASRESLDWWVRDAQERFEGRAVTRPPFWTGFRVIADSIEYWPRDPTRLHERIPFKRQDDHWVRTLLFP